MPLNKHDTHEMTHQVESEGDGESQGAEESLRPPCSVRLAHLNCILVVAYVLALLWKVLAQSALYVVYFK